MLVAMTICDQDGLLLIQGGSLIIVGALMSRSLGKLKWHDPAHAVTAFLTVMVMPLTYSIGTLNPVHFFEIPYANFFFTLNSVWFDRRYLLLDNSSRNVLPVVSGWY